MVDGEDGPGVETIKHVIVQGYFEPLLSGDDGLETQQDGFDRAVEDSIHQPLEGGSAGMANAVRRALEEAVTGRLPAGATVHAIRRANVTIDVEIEERAAA